jgi:hypothetical protein
MNKNIYRDILIDNLQYSVDLIEIGAWFVFQQDLDSKHTAPAARDFFPENDARQLPWAPQSLDADPVENTWSILDAVVPISECVNKARFLLGLQQYWYDLDKKNYRRSWLSQFLQDFWILLGRKMDLRVIKFIFWS